MQSWNVFIFLHDDGKNRRCAKRIGRVKAPDAEAALQAARPLIEKARRSDRYGGFEVRRSDLPPLTQLIEEAERRKDAGETGWHQRFGRATKRSERREDLGEIRDVPDDSDEV
jgi:1,2-phenylacetyl-CoA epoxidase PaaB subunit